MKDMCLFEKEKEKGKEKVEITSKYWRPASPPPPEIEIAEIMGLTVKEMEECILWKRKSKGKEMEDEDSSLPVAKKKTMKNVEEFQKTLFEKEKEIETSLPEKEIEKSTFGILMDMFENSPSEEEIEEAKELERNIFGKRKWKEMKDKESSVLLPAKDEEFQKRLFDKESAEEYQKCLPEKASKSSQLVSSSPPQGKKELQTSFSIIDKDKKMAEFYQKGFTNEEIEAAMKKIEEAMKERIDEAMKEIEESKRCIFGESSLTPAKKMKKMVMTVKKTVLIKKKTTVKKTKMVKKKKKKMVKKKKKIINSDIAIPGYKPPYFFSSMDEFESYTKTLRETDNYFVDPSTFPKNLADSGYIGIRPNVIPIIPRPVNYFTTVHPTDEEINQIILFALKQEEKKQNFLKLERIKYCNQEKIGMYRHYYITFEASSSSDDETNNNNKIIADYQTKVRKTGLTGFLKLEQFRHKPQSSNF